MAHAYAMATQVIKTGTQLVQDSSELVLIVFVAWAAVELKNRVIENVRAGLEAR